MWIFRIGEVFASIVVMMLPRRFADRIEHNSSEYSVYVLKSEYIKKKPRMTYIEAVFATILFDLALFGTSNIFIKSIIRLFTSFQNAWDQPFISKEDGVSQIQEFCSRLSIQQDPWIWEKNIEDYTSLNDFFSRTYKKRNFPKLGSTDLIAPACCTMTMYNDNADLEKLLVKGCEYKIEDIGLPSYDVDLYGKHPVFVGYLSPTDYHRVHAPISGVCTHCKMEGVDKKSASVKFFDGSFNILNENKRLVVVIEAGDVAKIALVIIGGIGVDSIHLLGNHMKVGQSISKGDQLAAFRAGGSAIAMFSTRPLSLTKEFRRANEECQHVEVEVGESIANICGRVM